MKSLFNVTGKVVLITGSSRGIGFSLAKGFCEAGAEVVLNGRSEISLNKAVRFLNNRRSKVIGFAFDVTDEESVSENIERIEKEVGTISVLINNVGIQRRAPFEEMTLNEWKEVINTDLNSAFVVSHAVSKYMIPRRYGRIINITSLNSEAARPTIANYCTAKGGLKMLTKALAVELGKYNILTNAIGPGYFITDLTKSLQENPEFDKWVKSKVPLQRWGKPEELIGAAIFLASDAASYINGHTIYVDGGWQAGL